MKIKKTLNIAAIMVVLFVSVGNCEENTKAAIPEQIKDTFCPEAWSVFSAEQRTKPAPNITLLKLQHVNADDKCVQNLDINEIQTLTIEVQKLAGQVFSKSKSDFEIMVRFTLAQTQPATVEMRYTDSGESAYKQLEAFHASLVDMKNHHSQTGTAYVVFHYKIEKAQEQ